MPGQPVNPGAVRERDHQPAGAAGQAPASPCAGLPPQPLDRHPQRGLQPHLSHHPLPQVWTNHINTDIILTNRRFNRIKEVDPYLGNLVNLTNLSIRENQITSLPATIGFDQSHHTLGHWRLSTTRQPRPATQQAGGSSRDHRQPHSTLKARTQVSPHFLGPLSIS